MCSSVEVNWIEWYFLHEIEQCEKVLTDNENSQQCSGIKALISFLAYLRPIGLGLWALNLGHHYRFWVRCVMVSSFDSTQSIKYTLHSQMNGKRRSVKNISYFLQIYIPKARRNIQLTPNASER